MLAAKICTADVINVFGWQTHDKFRREHSAEVVSAHSGASAKDMWNHLQLPSDKFGFASEDSKLEHRLAGLIIASLLKKAHLKFARALH